MALSIISEFATDDEIARGVAAARDVFSAHGRQPEYCQAQHDAFRAGDDFDAPALQTWYEAENVALAACFDGAQNSGARLTANA